MSRTVRTVPASEYQPGSSGFLIEYDYGDGDGQWAIPDWTEWSMPHFDVWFDTEEEAQAAIDQHYADLGM